MHFAHPRASSAIIESERPNVGRKAAGPRARAEAMLPAVSAALPGRAEGARDLSADVVHAGLQQNEARTQRRRREAETRLVWSATIPGTTDTGFARSDRNHENRRRAAARRTRVRG